MATSNYTNNKNDSTKDYKNSAYNIRIILFYKITQYKESNSYSRKQIPYFLPFHVALPINLVYQYNTIIH